MKTTRSLAGLEKDVERLVREHIVDHLQKMKQAVERGYCSGRREPSRQRSAGPRRPKRIRMAAETAKLSEKLYSLVCLTPGSTMAALAAEVGLSSSALYRSMQALKKAGRVRSAGERQFTRYFPMATTTEAAG